MSGRSSCFTRTFPLLDMKDVLSRVFCRGILIGWSGFSLLAHGQVNSWTNPASGNWEDASSWSLGVLPGTNQTVMLTNYGWKAVQISANTAQNFPQSLEVNSIAISSPTNSFNTLLMNYAGPATPLTVQSLSVASNSAMTMYSSALQLDGPNGVGMQIGGEFNQNDSVVAGNQVNVGYIGPGVYNLNGGMLDVSYLWVGGQYQGVFIQNGGTNAFGITDIQGGGYVLSNGYFAAAVYFNNGQFTQEGGLLATNLTIYEGSYLLAGGVHQGSVMVPWTDGYSSGMGRMVQTGGTNFGSLDIGSCGNGSYTLSNGISSAGGLLVDYGGTYNQSGGVQIVTNTIAISEEQITEDAYEAGFLNLHAGQMSCSGLSLAGYYTQTGGTNLIPGDVTTSGIQPTLSVSGGLLIVNNITANPGLEGGIFLAGGTLVVSNELWIGGNSEFPDWQGFAGSGGQLIVSNIWLAPQSTFSCGAGSVSQSGTLTLANATLYAGSAPAQFGRLELSSDGNTNSILSMPAGATVVRFADSSGEVWSNGVSLMIENWTGSLYGGGQQRIVFGNSSAALTAQQLAQIDFQNPAGLVAGTYPARILSTGELVPDPAIPLPTQMSLQPQANGMLLTIQGEAGSNYTIEISTNLVNWVAWTNQVDSNGTFSVTDTGTTNCPMRFYRTVLVP